MYAAQFGCRTLQFNGKQSVLLRLCAPRRPQPRRALKLAMDDLRSGSRPLEIATLVRNVLIHGTISQVIVNLLLQC